MQRDSVEEDTGLCVFDWARNYNTCGTLSDEYKRSSFVFFKYTIVSADHTLPNNLTVESLAIKVFIAKTKF